MSGDITAAGDAITGALAARTVEPHAGAGHGGHPGLCLNCGTRLIGAHCHACGQSGHVHRTLGGLGHELAHGVFHFEGKIWRTLPMLVLHPGALTRRYVAGERARFVSPLALFLFTVFLMFAVYGLVGPGDIAEQFQGGVGNAAAKVAEGRTEARQALARTMRDRAAAAALHRPTAMLDRRIMEERQNLAALDRVAGKLVDPPSAIKVSSNWDWLDRGLHRARANPGLVIYQVQSAAYKFSWALIPLSIPFVALLFLGRRRRFTLYDHAIFVTYSISFMSLLVIVEELLLSFHAPGVLFAMLLVLAPPAHLFAQLRGAYALSALSAAWRTAFLLLFATMVLAAFVIGIIALEVTH